MHATFGSDTGIKLAMHSWYAQHVQKIQRVFETDRKVARKVTKCWFSHANWAVMALYFLTSAKNHKSIIFPSNSAIVTSLFRILDRQQSHDSLTCWSISVGTDSIPLPTFPTTFYDWTRKLARFMGKHVWLGATEKNSFVSHLHSSNSSVQVWTRKSHVLWHTRRVAQISR